ncbi:hypothetical protein MFRU_007g02010 [Monilinia fructicola]|uniref:Annexin n=1 Tax=Monilinia fructicola TaxID=38448 RepID=A0A5M9JH07_MONFR|nr:hypothetical protein EYC84_010162 [Monilinia fructicola]KAG4032292.1 hypothetical protein MFRU_007g02010 [Monilinia fructicola]
MSYQNYPPYGAPPAGLAPQSGYPPQIPPRHSPQAFQQYPPSLSPYPQSQPYGAPSQQSPYPPQQQPYQPYPPQHGSYPQHQPPYGAPPPGPTGQYPPPQQQPYPPPQSGYPQQPYGAPAPAAQTPYGAPTSYGQPTPPSPGYDLSLASPPRIPYDGRADAQALRKAMKGFGTDEATLINVLHNKGPLQIEVLRQAFSDLFKRKLLADVESETSSYFREGLAAIIRGPLMQDCHLLYTGMDGIGTKEKYLTEVLMGRSNADINAIKSMYQRRYKRSLAGDLKGDLSMKTEDHFLMVLEANRNEDSAPVVPRDVDRDVAAIWNATEAIRGHEAKVVCEIFTKRNDAQLRAINHTYQQKHGKPLEGVIKKFSGHMEGALLHQLRTATDKAMRDANLLEESMQGFGTKDKLLVARVIRCHWDPRHMEQVKGAYHHAYKRSLSSRIAADTSGDYEKLMVKCVECSSLVQPGYSWF